MPRQTKSPSLTQDLLMLGDVYTTLAWLAYQRLRHGPLWPWETRSKKPAVLTLLRPQEKEERSKSATPKRG